MSIKPVRFITDITGEVTSNGSAIKLTIKEDEKDRSDLYLRIEDVQYLVNLLLFLESQASMQQRGEQRLKSAARV